MDYFRAKSVDSGRGCALNNYDPTDGGRKIENFVSDLSNWQVRRSRRRFWKSENDSDRLSAYNTLYTCLVTLIKLLAPLYFPFRGAIRTGEVGLPNSGGKRASD
jgi:isoleucyl-tRNA synthetase